MTQAIQYIAQAVGSWVGSATGSATLAKVATWATTAAITVGVNAAVNSAMTARNGLPEPEATQVPYNDTRPKKRWGTGRLRVSGPALLFSSVPQWNIEVRAIHEGPIDGFEQIYLHDDKVTLKSSNYVASFPTGSVNQRYAEDLIRIYTRPGRTTEIPTAALVSASAGEWTTAHRADGVAAIDMMVKAIAIQDLQRVYPNGEPKVSAVARLSKVYDPRDPTQSLTNPATWKWTDNAALGHLTYEWFGRFIRYAREDYITPNARQLKEWNRRFAPALASWKAAADVCDEVVATKAGGTRKRYRASVMAYSDSDPAEVRKQYLAAYDGMMLRTRDGAWNVVAGKYYAPTLTFGDRDFVGIKWSRGQKEGQRVNMITGGFLSPANDYTMQPVDAWLDQYSIDTFGEKSEAFDLPQVDDHGQARALFKRKLIQKQAARTGLLTLQLDSGLKIFDVNDDGLPHRFIRLQVSKGPSTIRNVILEVMDQVTVEFASERVTVPVRVANPNIDLWDPALEEGYGPNETTRQPPMTLSAPDILGVTADGQTIRVRTSAPTSALTEYQVSYRRTGQADWRDDDFASFETASEGGVYVRSLTTGGGVLYEVRLRQRLTNILSDWTYAGAYVSVPRPQAAFVDGVNVDDLRPAQAGADVTGLNTSANTNAVGSRPATSVLAQIDGNSANILTEEANRIAAVLNEATLRNAQIVSTAATLQASIDTQGANVGALTGRVTTVENAQTAQASEISGLWAGLSGKASTTALDALTVTVTQQGNTLTTYGSSILSLNSAVSGLNGTTAGLASGLSAVETRVTATESGINTLALQLASVSTKVGAISADGLWSIAVQAGSGDVVARAVLRMRATISDSWAEVGTVWEAGFSGGVPFSRETHIAQQFRIIGPGGSQVVPFEVDGDIVKITNLYISGVLLSGLPMVDKDDPTREVYQQASQSFQLPYINDANSYYSELSYKPRFVKVAEFYHNRADVPVDQRMQSGLNRFRYLAAVTVDAYLSTWYQIQTNDGLTLLQDVTIVGWNIDSAGGVGCVTNCSSVVIDIPANSKIVWYVSVNQSQSNQNAATGTRSMDAGQGEIICLNQR